MFLSWKRRDLGQATKLLDPRRGRNLGQVIVKCACVGVGQFAFRVILCNQVYKLAEADFQGNLKNYLRARGLFLVDSGNLSKKS